MGIGSRLGLATRDPALALPWLALGTVYFLWGTAFLAIRVAVRSVPPFVMGGGRYVVAAALLFPIAFLIESRQRPSARRWWRYVVAGAVMFVGGNGLLNYGELHIPSGVAGVLIATIPLWMVLIEIGRRRLRLGFTLVGALAAGIAGVAILVRPGDTAPLDPLAAAAVLLAAASWAGGSLWIQDDHPPGGPLTVAAVEMASGGAAMLAIAVVTGELRGFELSTVPAEAWLAMGWLVLPSGIVTFGAYTYVLRVLPASLVAPYPFVNSVVAVGLGWLFLQEAVTPQTVVGCGIVLASAGLIARRAVTTRRQGANASQATVLEPAP